MVISQRKSIQKKLMAATSMLLVACIMLISASYAWFTLSTAPEITGITTTVGANGNLEIALADSTTWSSPDESVQTGVGIDGLTAKNITWGNLVDLSDGYGLNLVSLLPARLVLSGDGKLSGTGLQYPKYGTDGRIDGLNGASLGKLTGGAFQVFDRTTNDNDGRGFSVIGASSSMSQREIAYRAARTALATAVANAKAKAQASLVDNGNGLANIVMKKATDDNPSYDNNEVKPLKDTITALVGAGEELLKAWEQAVAAYAMSEAGKEFVNEFEAFQTAMNNRTYTLDNETQPTTVTAGGEALILPTNFGTYYKELKETIANIASAKKAADGLTGESVSWDQLKVALDPILNYTNMTINGIKASEVKEHINELISAVANGLQVEMPSGSGAYADIADFCGDYASAIVIREISYGNQDAGGISVENLDATMTTKSNVSPSKFSNAQQTVIAAGTPQGSDTVQNITEYYGYMVDFYLRTNASAANLQLQVDAAQRIYSDSSNEQTQGGGSTMTFTGGNLEQMKKLMGAVRVVFLDGEGKVLQIATLDADKATAAGTTAEAKLQFVNYTIDDTTGKLNITGLKGTTTSTGEGESTSTTFTPDTTITGLKQNEATKISVLVYLDGDVVTNGMLNSNGAGITTSLNLQFSTDTELVPMDDAGLKGQTATTPPSTEEASTNN